MKLSSILLPALFALPLAACGGGGSGTSGAADPASAVSSCTTCHSFAKDAPRRAGPNLFGVVGRAAGAQPGFGFSPALKDSGIIWTAETLDAFLAAPQTMVPGNRMGMPGISDAAKRKAAVDYILTLK